MAFFVSVIYINQSPGWWVGFCAYVCHFFSPFAYCSLGIVLHDYAISEWYCCIRWIVSVLLDHGISHWHPIFRHRIGGLSFSSNLLASLLLCGATVLRATFTMKDAPCKLNSIGFQDIFLFNSSSNDKEKRKFVGTCTILLLQMVPNSGTLNECVTADSVVILYCCLGLIILSFLCSLFQLFANLNINLQFIKKFRRRGLLDVCCGTCMFVHSLPFFSFY